MVRTRTFHEVSATRWGRFQLWMLYGLPRKVVLPLVPKSKRWEVIKAARRRVFGPNANNEDLNELLEQALQTTRSRRAHP